MKKTVVWLLVCCLSIGSFSPFAATAEFESAQYQLVITPTVEFPSLGTVDMQVREGAQPDLLVELRHDAQNGLWVYHLATGDGRTNTFTVTVQNNSVAASGISGGFTGAVACEASLDWEGTAFYGIYPSLRAGDASFTLALGDTEEIHTVYAQEGDCPGALPSDDPFYTGGLAAVLTITFTPVYGE